MLADAIAYPSGTSMYSSPPISHTISLAERDATTLVFFGWDYQSVKIREDYRPKNKNKYSRMQKLCEGFVCAFHPKCSHSVCTRLERTQQPKGREKERHPGGMVRKNGKEHSQEEVQHRIAHKEAEEPATGISPSNSITRISPSPSASARVSFNGVQPRSFDALVDCEREKTELVDEEGDPVELEVAREGRRETHML